MLSALQLNAPHRVLVVDDDMAMRRVVSDYLQEHGLCVDLAADFEDMKAAMETAEPSMIILDLKLGDVDGLDILRNLRTRSDLPVMIVTGHRGEEIDRVIGLELGADDYITKPFSLRELLARVRVILRRVDTLRMVRIVDADARESRAKSGTRAKRLMRFGGWTLDRRLRELRRPDDTLVPLTNGDYTLLVAFLDAPLTPLSREHLLQATRVHENVFDRSIDVQILRLRRKIDIEPKSPSMIRTERSIGYVFTVLVESE